MQLTRYAIIRRKIASGAGFSSIGWAPERAKGTWLVKSCTPAMNFRVVFLYVPPTNCYVAYTVIRRKIVFICSASYAVYTVISRKIGFM